VWHQSLNPRYTFGQFLWSASGNRLAHAACQAVADKTCQGIQSALSVRWRGLGKDTSASRHRQCLLCPWPECSLRFVRGVHQRDHQPPSARIPLRPSARKYRSCRRAAGGRHSIHCRKESTQEEFFSTPSNTLHGQDKQIIVSSDRPPKSSSHSKNECARASSGAWRQIFSLPTWRPAWRYCGPRAERTGRRIPDEILESVARRVQSNIRELERGAKTASLRLRISAVRLFTRSWSRMPWRTCCLKRQTVLPGNASWSSLPENGRTTSEALLGREPLAEGCRAAPGGHVPDAQRNGRLTPQIGEVLGGRDHTTVMYAIDKNSPTRLRPRQKLRKRVINVKQQLYGQGAVI